MGNEPVRMKPPSSEEALFAGALQRDTPAARAAYLNDACGTNNDLRRRIETLLQATEKAGDR